MIFSVCVESGNIHKLSKKITIYFTCTVKIKMLYNSQQNEQLQDLV